MHNQEINKRNHQTRINHIWQQKIRLKYKYLISIIEYSISLKDLQFPPSKAPTKDNVVPYPIISEILNIFSFKYLRYARNIIQEL